MKLDGPAAAQVNLSRQESRRLFVRHHAFQAGNYLGRCPTWNELGTSEPSSLVAIPMYVTAWKATGPTQPSPDVHGPKSQNS